MKDLVNLTDVRVQTLGPAMCSSSKVHHFDLGFWSAKFLTVRLYPPISKPGHSASSLPIEWPVFYLAFVASCCPSALYCLPTEISEFWYRCWFLARYIKEKVPICWFAICHLSTLGLKFAWRSSSRRYWISILRSIFSRLCWSSSGLTSSPTCVYFYGSNHDLSADLY